MTDFYKIEVEDNGILFQEQVEEPKRLSEKDVLDKKTIVCASCNKELGEALIVPGEKTIKMGSKYFTLDCLKAICQCGEESFLLKYKGKLKYNTFLPITDQYIDGTMTCVKYC